MDALHTKIEQINGKFKNNAIVTGIVNISILALVFVFFSIGFDLTKKLLLDFIDLSWASIFPSIVDLTTVGLLILLLRSFSKIINSPDFLLHLEDKDIEGNEAKNDRTKIEFLKNTNLSKIKEIMWYLILLLFLNFIVNMILEAGNKQFSPINEWYLLSSAFTHLPIFPINLMCIFILIGILVPTALNYAKYQVEVAKITNVSNKWINKDILHDRVNGIKVFRIWIFIALSIFCIGMSLMQRHKIWIFQYNQPIAEESALSEKTEYLMLCANNFSYTTYHNRDILVQTKHVETSVFGGGTKDRTEKDHYAITPELKEKIQAKCKKEDEDDRKQREEKERALEKEFEQTQKGKK